MGKGLAKAGPFFYPTVPRSWLVLSGQFATIRQVGGS
jgi:hypothetical protein